MTLAQMIANLNTKTATVKVIDATTSTELITFKVSGIDSVDDEVSGRTVSYWTVDSATSITVALAGA